MVVPLTQNESMNVAFLPNYVWLCIQVRPWKETGWFYPSLWTHWAAGDHSPYMLILGCM